MNNERDFKSIPLPPKHRIYEVGDEIAYGAHDQAVIEAISADGRLYDLTVTNDRKKSYQTEPNLVSQYRKNIPWTSLMPMSTRDKDAQPPAFSNSEYYPLSYMQQDIYSLLSRCYNNYEGVDFDPDYQRGHVWEMEDKISLLDSIFAKRDIGKFVFNSRDYADEGPLCEIIDGKQRLSAIKEFAEDRYKYRGYYFSELNWQDRNTFSNKSVSVAELDEATEEEILETFLAVNITGRQQNTDHINHVKELLKEKNDA